VSTVWSEPEIERRAVGLAAALRGAAAASRNDEAAAELWGITARELETIQNALRRRQLYADPLGNGPFSLI